MTQFSDDRLSSDADARVDDGDDSLYNDNGEFETEVNDSNETIGLFGITSCTGGHLVKLMLDAGYSVKALIAANDVVEVEHDQLQLVVGGLEDLEKLEQVIMEASYIICLLGDSFVKSDYNGGILVDFIKRIYPIMKESNTQVFIYQATAVSIDTSGHLPGLSKLVKGASGIFTNTALQKDHDAVVKYIGDNTGDWFSFIVTRPGTTRNGPSKKKLAASRSQPGPIPVMNVDLAEFTLQALKNQALYNKCPYVVGDGFR